MRALVLHGPGDIRLEEVPIPSVGEGEVLLQVAWCGVCGSDIPRIFSTGAHRHPIVPGHEFAGVVAEVGPGVSCWKAGQGAVAFPLIWCGQCPACETGKYAQCSNYDYLGSRSDGAMAEYVVCPARNLRATPAGLDLAHAAMAEPAAVALHAVRRVVDRLPGAVVAVFGAGPIGNLAAQWARRFGADAVILLDVQEERLETARRMGLVPVVNSTSVDPLQAIAGLTGGRGAVVCIEAAGVPATVVQACRALATGGSLVLLGNPSADVTIPRDVVSRILRAEASIVGIWNSTFLVHGSGDDWDTALGAMADGSLSVESLISHRVPLTSGLDVLRSMFDRRGTFQKVLIRGRD